MTGTDENSSDKPRDIDDEIERAMSEAAAAVDSVRDGPTKADEAIVTELEIDDEFEGAGADDRASELEQKVEALTAEKAELRDKWMRALADQENQRKRARRDTDDAIQAATSKLLESFLPTVDNLDRALGAAKDADTQLVEGIRMVIREFITSLGKHGITPIESVGTVFDPNFHDALQQMDSPDHAPGVIVQEFEKGYRRGDRLLRPARVIVAGPGSTGEPPAETGGDPVDA